MMYLLTEAQHAALIAAYTEDWGDIEQAVAMLKAMQPVDSEAALRAQPNHSVIGFPITEVDPFPVMGNPISPHRELIAELRKPMHYLSMAKRNRCANALEGK